MGVTFGRWSSCRWPATNCLLTDFLFFHEIDFCDVLTKVLKEIFSEPERNMGTNHST